MEVPDPKPLPPIVPPVDNVPPELMRELHEATEKFRQQKEEVEAVTNKSEFDHQGGIDAATEKLREAERNLEAIDQKVKNSLRK